jgi:protein SCO1/2
MPQLMSFSVIALGLFVWWQATLGFRALTWESYRRLQLEDRPQAVPNLVLEDQRGRRFDLASLKGKLVVVNFFYTRCTTLCSATGLIYANLQRALVQYAYQDKVRLLSVSLEPQRDTPPQLMQYMQRFTTQVDGPWLSVHALSQQDNENLLHKLGVVSIPDGQGGIRHNAASHVIDTQGRLVRIMDETNIDQIMESIEALLPSTG